jgi:hypothetical protein
VAHARACASLPGRPGWLSPSATEGRPGGEDTQGKEIMLGTDRLLDVVRGHKKSVAYLGAALALASAGTANAATLSPAAASAASPAAITARAQARTLADTTAQAGSSSQRVVDTRRPAARPGRPSAIHVTTARRSLRVGAAREKAVTWGGVSGELNRETNPAAARHHLLPAADKLLPAALSGPQSSMPISPAQYANATAIVAQALGKHMGVRAAVIAVATAMQESRLVNVAYGTSDSLGLFQQRPSCGWGSAAQIMNPRYAAGSFLDALARYQASDPGWAAQPLYQAAQGVQGSAFPYAYAQWESQAAGLVRSIAMRLR